MGDLVQIIYQKYTPPQWRNDENIKLNIGDTVKLHSGHIGTVALLQSIDVIKNEGTQCEGHRLCVFGQTAFVGIILNEWDYHGHDGSIGCTTNKWFESPQGKGLLVPLIFIEFKLDQFGVGPISDDDTNDDEKEEKNVPIPAINVVNTMSTEMVQELEVLSIDEQQKWFNSQINAKREESGDD